MFTCCLSHPDTGRFTLLRLAGLGQGGALDQSFAAFDRLEHCVACDAALVEEGEIE